MPIPGEKFNCQRESVVRFLSSMMTLKNKSGRPIIRRHIIMAAFMLVATVFSSGILNSTPAAAASPVEAMVKKFGTQVLGILGSGASTSQQEKQFRTAFLRNADIGTIARFTLGKYARTISAAERKEFHRLLGHFIVKVFVSRMKGTKSSGIVIIGTTERKKGRDFLVKSRINVSGKSPIRVNWRIFKNKSGRLKIFDISIQGLWLAQEQRSIFVNIISRNNGKIRALLTHLKQQIAKSS